MRGSLQPELSKKLYKLIKTENNVIGAYEQAGRERVSIANQLSEWGEQTGDDAISDISDKVGVVLAEIGEQEDLYAHNLDDSRAILKAIRNMEKSVQPSRDNKQKIMDEIAKLKAKEPESAKITVLEQELVRAEAENLVAEAQLTNITRQKLKETYDLELAATIERAEKQILLAKHGRRLLNLLDDSPVIPGDVRQPYEGAHQARQILSDCEEDLRNYRLEVDPVESSAHHLGSNAMPSEHGGAERINVTGERMSGEDAEGRVAGSSIGEGSHLTQVTTGSGSVTTGHPYSERESEADLVH